MSKLKTVVTVVQLTIQIYSMYIWYMHVHASIEGHLFLLKRGQRHWAQWPLDYWTLLDIRYLPGGESCKANMVWEILS